MISEKTITITQAENGFIVEIERPHLPPHLMMVDLMKTALGTEAQDDSENWKKDLIPDNIALPSATPKHSETHVFHLLDEVLFFIDKSFKK